MSACSPGHLLPCLRSSDSVPPSAIMKLINLRKNRPDCQLDVYRHRSSLSVSGHAEGRVQGWAGQWAHCVRVLRRSSITASFFAKNDALRDGKSYARSTRQARTWHGRAGSVQGSVQGWLTSRLTAVAPAASSAYHSVKNSEKRRSTCQEALPRVQAMM